MPVGVADLWLPRFDDLRSELRGGRLTEPRYGERFEPGGGTIGFMCGYAEWENLLRRVEDAVEEGHVRDFLSEAAAGIDALIDEITGWGCAPENMPWVRGRGPGSRREWVV